MTWWLIPLIVTIVALALAITRDTRGDGLMDGAMSLFYMCCALFISVTAWAIAGVFK